MTQGDFVLGGVLCHQVLISGVKILGLTFIDCIRQWRISILFLVEGIVWGFWTFFVVNPMIWLSHDDVVCALWPSWRRRSWRTIFVVRVCRLVMVVPATSLLSSAGIFYFFFFWLCVSLMSLLPLDNMVSEAGFSWYMLGIKILSLSTKWKYLRKHGKWAITMMTTNQAKTTSRGFYILQKNTLCWGGDANI
jgi:hypothetical protein